MMPALTSVMQNRRSDMEKASVKAGGDGEGPGRALALDVDPRYPVTRMLGGWCWHYRYVLIAKEIK